ncbi:MAG: sigma 54-interacting transcriptional regulator [bacterium]
MKKAHKGCDFRHAMNHYMACLIQKRDFTAAVKFYEDNRVELEAAAGAPAGSVLRHAAEAYASLSNYPTALKTARLAQNRVAQEGDSRDLAETFLTLGGILRDMCEFKEAEKAFRDAESIFRRQDSPEGQSRALNLLAGLFYKQSDYRNALSVLTDAVEIIRKLGDERKLAYMMGNIGRIHTFLGDFSKAEEHLQMNVDLSGELGDTSETIRAGIALGYVYIRQDRFSEAEQMLDKADRQIAALNGRRNEVISLTYRGELYYRWGRLPEAQQALDSARRLAEEITPNTTLTARVLRHLAELHLLKQEFSAARQCASKAMAIMDRAGNSVEIGALLRIKAVIAEADGNESEGREYFAQALELIRESGVRFELARTLVQAGQSNLFPDRQRLVYLFRAEEFYRRHALTAGIQEVEKIINGIDYPLTSSVADPTTGSVGRVNSNDYLTACPVIKRFLSQLPAIGRSDLPLLLTGETGVGKDHLARHYHSLVRPQAPLVAVNCASFPETLLESELFGYRRGAFTGADSDKPGLFVTANQGVLYLDEIGDMPLVLQAKLLGVLETRRVMPLGSTEEVQLDIKLVVATNNNLEEKVDRGEFRRDLFYRLSGFAFHLPALRERKEDIPLLLAHFMANSRLLKSNGPPPTELVHQFIEHNWPGNTRELLNKVRQLEVMVELVKEGDLVELSRSIFSPEREQVAQSLFERVEQLERRMIVEALLASRGNKSEAARMLGIHEATIRTKVRRYQINLEGGVVH